MLPFLVSGLLICCSFCLHFHIQVKQKKMNPTCLSFLFTPKLMRHLKAATSVIQYLISSVCNVRMIDCKCNLMVPKLSCLSFYLMKQKDSSYFSLKIFQAVSTL